MTLSIIKRKALFFLFITAFCVLTPYIILYASGYQLDWKHPFSPLMVQKTGMTIVYSEPSGANIYLNEKKQKYLNLSLFRKDTSLKTPTKIKNLLPGSYDLRVEMPGYWSWSRRINVYSGQITHVLDVELFRKDLPILVANGVTENLYPSPNLKKILINNGATLLDLKTEESEKITASSASAIWSDDSSKFILGQEIINPKDKNKDLSLEKIIGSQISNLKWATGNSNEVFYSYKKTLNNFKLDNKTNTIIADNEDILDYLPEKNDVFYIAQNGFSAKLKIYSLADKKIKKEIELPPSDGYVFLKNENGLLNLYDSKYKISYLVDPSSADKPLIEIINDAKYFQWFNDKTLFYANDSEIWLLNMETQNRRLLLRWSEPLKGIIKTKNDNYVFFYTDNSLKVLSWDKGDEKLQVTEFLKLEKIQSPFLNENESTLYFSGKIGNQEGLYKLNLK